MNTQHQLSRDFLIIVAIVGLIAYIAINIWLYYNSPKTSSLLETFLPSTSLTQPKTGQQPGALAPLSTGKTSTTGSFPNPGKASASAQEKTLPGSLPKSTVQATPTPLQGPGKYACDPTGVCNNYGDEQRKSCPVTFADRNCLDQCSDKTKRCSQ